MIRTFIWDGKRSRISLRLLHDSKSRAGLGLPNMEIYYHTANLLWLKKWVQLGDLRILELEVYKLNFGLHATLIYELGTKEFKNNFLRKTLLMT